MTKCPRCFNNLTHEWFAWTEAAPQRTEPDERATAFTGSPVVAGKTCELQKPADAAPDWTPPPNYPETQLGGAAVEICPICHFVLPPHWRWGQATCIAMAGARATGKTVYIAVMIKQLQLLAERMNRAVEPATPETDYNYRKNYENPLFEERGILVSTPSSNTGDSYQREPLIFSLGVWNEVRRFLVIRDVAGEDLESGNTDGHSWQFFQVADAILFLFDPLRVEEIGDQLRDLVPVQANRGGDPKVVLRTVMNMLGYGTPRVAVVLSKFDALQALEEVQGGQWSQIMSNAGAAFSRDPSLEQAPYADEDGQLLHEEVRSLLQKLDAGPMLQSMENPVTGQQYRNRFFAVSALGASPVGERLHENGISPFRCLDPVRWVLSEHGVL